MVKAFIKLILGSFMGFIYLEYLKYILIGSNECHHTIISSTKSLKNENEILYLNRSVKGEINLISKEKVRFLPKNCSSMTDSNQITQKNLVFVGVMTTANFTLTRAKAVYETWAKNIPGKVVFFSSEKTQPTNAIPLVRLKGVNDDYPPQKKSLYMLKYIFDHYLNKYEFFYRADDDLFIRGEELEKFLSSINSSKALMIGQPGLGTPAEKGHLSLGEGEYFCLGGPGIIFSRELLKKLGNKIYKCFRNFLTIHEDVELWRCVKQQVGISCVTDEMFGDLFHHNLGGKKAFSSHLTDKDFSNTISLHPLKNPQLHLMLSATFQGSKIKEKESKMVLAMKELHKLRSNVNSSVVPLSSLRFQEDSFIYHLGLIEVSESRKEINRLPFSFYNKSAIYFAGRHISKKLLLGTNSEGYIAIIDMLSSKLKKLKQHFKFYPSIVYLRNNPSFSVEYFLAAYKESYHYMKTTYVQNLITRSTVPYGPLYIREAEVDFDETKIKI